MKFGHLYKHVHQPFLIRMAPTQLCKTTLNRDKQLSVCHLAEQLRGKEDTVSVSIIQLPCPGKELFSEGDN